MKLKQLFKLLWSKLISNWNNLNGYSSYLWLCNESIRSDIFPLGIRRVIWVGNFCLYKLSFLHFFSSLLFWYFCFFWFIIIFTLFFEFFFYRRDYLKLFQRKMFDLFGCFSLLTLFTFSASLCCAVTVSFFPGGFLSHTCPLSLQLILSTSAGEAVKAAVT